MTRFGLNINFGVDGLGYGAPIGRDWHLALAARNVDSLRQNVPLNPDRVEALIVDHADMPIRPHLLLHQLSQVYDLGRRTLEIGIASLGADGFDCGVVNEGSITGVTVDQAVDAIEHMQRLGDELGFAGRFYADSVPNLDPRRDFDRMRAFWPRLSQDVVRDFHRYPEIRYPWHVDDLHPWHQFASLEQEFDVVKASAAGPLVSCSEFSFSTVQRHGWGGFGDRRVTDQQSAEYLTTYLVACAKAGLTDAFVFQFNDGPDPNEWGHCQGIVDIHSNWKPQAECFARARALVATEQENGMKWHLVKVVKVGAGSVLVNPNGKVRSLNPATQTGGPYHWEERPADADGAYEVCTPGNGTVAYNPVGEVVVFGFKDAVPNAGGFSAVSEDPL